MLTNFKTTTRHLCLCLLAAAAPQFLTAAGPDKLDLLSTESFVILAGSAITTTGGGAIVGDVGVSPAAGSFIGVTCDQVTGTIYAVDAAGPACAVIDASLLTTAKGDLTIAYNDAAGRTPIPTGPNLNPGDGNIGGLTLSPGLYKFTSDALISGADLTLQGGPEDVWIFQIATGLELASGVKVILAGGARAENIFWQVGSSAVLGTFSVFKGTILADQSITMGTSSTIEGRALAFEAGVVFNGSGAAAPVVLIDEPEIVVEEPLGVEILDGGNRDFGSVVVGGDNSLTFTIKNTGNADLSVDDIVIDGVDAALFSLTLDPSPAIVSGPNGSTTFSVQFAPLTTGLKAAALRIVNNDSSKDPFDIALTGTATAAPVPKIIVEEPLGVDILDGGTRDFGSVAVGADNSLTFTIKNTGTADLTGLGITIDGTDALLFEIAANPTAPVVGPNGSTTFTVRFLPFTSGLKTAVLHIANNDSSKDPFDITLTGTVTSPVAVTILSPIALNPQTGLFEQTVRLTNLSPASVDAAQVLIQGLPLDVVVYNASGETGGVPFVQYNYTLAAFGSVDFVIEYYSTSREAILQPTFVAGAAAVIIPDEPTGEAFAIDRSLMLSDGRFLIEFPAITGRAYSVQYSSDLIDWITVVPSITAPSNRVQWYDDGPPKTESMPESVSSRFYRIFELP
ncbi:MAG: ice-binding family protein [Opitutales bacterium]